MSTLYTCIFIFCGLLLFCHLTGNIMFTCGMIRVKSVNTIICQNLLSFALVFAIHVLIGHDIMHGTEEPLSKTATWLNQIFNLAPIQLHTKTDFETSFRFFQTLLPCISVTLIASITAERLRLLPFFIFTFIFTVLIFPVAAHWVWGRSWLTQYGFIDHSGSSLVYLMGSLAGLTGSFVLGPRVKRFSPHALEASNIPLAFQGLMLIFLGCFGFNTGTYLMQENSLVLEKVALILINTCLAFSSGILIMTIVSRVLYNTIDITLMFNSGIAGIVAISPMPFYDTSAPALIIGAIAGLLAFVTSHILSAFKIEDPAGVVGSFGTATIIGLCTIPSSRSFLVQFFIQFTGIAAIALWVIGTSLCTWELLKWIFGLHYENQNTDLDIVECGISAYPQFQIKVSS